MKENDRRKQQKKIVQEKDKRNGQFVIENSITGMVTKVKDSVRFGRNKGEMCLVRRSERRRLIEKF